MSNSTSSDSEGYILNAIQTPGPIKPVYRSIRSGNKTKSRIKADCGIDSNLEASLSGLQLFRMIGREDGEYYATPYKWDLESEDLAFRMTALHNLAQECTEGDWGKQAVVLLDYHYLLDNDIQYFVNNDESMYNDIEEWFNTIDYSPQSSQGRIKHNEPKFANWTRIAHFLGLVNKIRGREHTVYPDPEMILTAIELSIDEKGKEVDNKPAIEITDYLQWLRENLLYVKTTSDGNVPKCLSRVLFELIRDGYIEYGEYGDTGAVGLDGVPPYEGIDREANTIAIPQE